MEHMAAYQDLAEKEAARGKTQTLDLAGVFKAAVAGMDKDTLVILTNVYIGFCSLRCIRVLPRFSVLNIA